LYDRWVAPRHAYIPRGHYPHQTLPLGDPLYRGREHTSKSVSSFHFSDNTEDRKFIQIDSGNEEGKYYKAIHVGDRVYWWWTKDGDPHHATAEQYIEDQYGLDYNRIQAYYDSEWQGDILKFKKNGSPIDGTDDKPISVEYKAYVTDFKDSRQGEPIIYNTTTRIAYIGPPGMRHYEFEDKLSNEELLNGETETEYAELDEGYMLVMNFESEDDWEEIGNLLGATQIEYSKYAKTAAQIDVEFLGQWGQIKDRYSFIYDAKANVLYVYPGYANHYAILNWVEDNETKATTNRINKIYSRDPTNGAAGYTYWDYNDDVTEKQLAIHWYTGQEWEPYFKPALVNILQHDGSPSKESNAPTQIDVGEILPSGEYKGFTLENGETFYWWTWNGRPDYRAGLDRLLAWNYFGDWWESHPYWEPESEVERYFDSRMDRDILNINHKRFYGADIDIGNSIDIIGERREGAVIADVRPDDGTIHWKGSWIYLTDSDELYWSDGKSGHLTLAEYYDLFDRMETEPYVAGWLMDDGTVNSWGSDAGRVGVNPDAADVNARVEEIINSGGGRNYDKERYKIYGSVSPTVQWVPLENDHGGGVPFLYYPVNNTLYLGTDEGYHYDLWAEALDSDDALNINGTRLDSQNLEGRVGIDGGVRVFTNPNRPYNDLSHDEVESIVDQASSLIRGKLKTSMVKIALDSYFSYMYIGGNVKKLFITGADFHYALLERYPEIEGYADEPQIWGRVSLLNYSNDSEKYDIDFHSDIMNNDSLYDEDAPYILRGGIIINRQEGLVEEATAAVDKWFKEKYLPGKEKGLEDIPVEAAYGNPEPQVRMFKNPLGYDQDYFVWIYSAQTNTLYAGKNFDYHNELLLEISEKAPDVLEDAEHAYTRCAGFAEGSYVRFYRGEGFREQILPTLTDLDMRDGQNEDITAKSVSKYPRHSVIKEANINWCPTDGSHGGGLPWIYYPDSDELYIGKSEGYHYSLDTNEPLEASMTKGRLLSDGEVVFYDRSTLNNKYIKSTIQKLRQIDFDNWPVEHPTSLEDSALGWSNPRQNDWYKFDKVSATDTPVPIHFIDSGTKGNALEYSDMFEYRRPAIWHEGEIFVGPYGWEHDQLMEELGIYISPQTDTRAISIWEKPSEFNREAKGPYIQFYSVMPDGVLETMQSTYPGYEIWGSGQRLAAIKIATEFKYYPDATGNDSPWEQMRNPVVYLPKEDVVAIGPPGAHHYPLMNALWDDNPSLIEASIKQGYYIPEDWKQEDKWDVPGKVGWLGGFGNYHPQQLEPIGQAIGDYIRNNGLDHRFEDKQLQMDLNDAN
jgi:hypothetical protein